MQDINRFEASIDRFSKQIFKQKEDLSRWRKKLQESLRDLSKLHKEIKEAKCCSILQIYQRSKDLEIQNSKQNIKTNHIVKINTFYHMDSENLRRMFSLACEIIQKNYLVLNYDHSVDSELKARLEKLSRLMNGHGIKFKDDENKSSDDELELTFDEFVSDDGKGIELQLNGKRMHSGGEDDDIVSTIKRNKKLFEDTADLGVGTIDNGSELFKCPNEVNHNETQVLPTAADEYEVYNSTFEISGVENKKKVDFISSILSEQNVSAANRLKIKNGKRRNILNFT